MTEEERYDELRRLRNNAITLFAYQPDLKDERVVGAIISAATGMSIASDKGNKDNTREMLLEAFKAVDGVNDEELNPFLELSPTHVKAIIGYAVDFRDYGAALAEYESRKDDYDSFYSCANYLKEQKGISL